jgi:hypothetical protein
VLVADAVRASPLSTESVQAHPRDGGQELRLEQGECEEGLRPAVRSGSRFPGGPIPPNDGTTVRSLPRRNRSAGHAKEPSLHYLVIVIAHLDPLPAQDGVNSCRLPGRDCVRNLLSLLGRRPLHWC